MALFLNHSWGRDTWVLWLHFHITHCFFLYQGAQVVLAVWFQEGYRLFGSDCCCKIIIGRYTISAPYAGVELSRNTKIETCRCPHAGTYETRTRCHEVQLEFILPSHHSVAATEELAFPLFQIKSVLCHNWYIHASIHTIPEISPLLLSFEFFVSTDIVS